MLGWYAKLKLKHTLAFAICLILIWLFFFSESSNYEAKNCKGAGCVVETSYGDFSTGGDCNGKGCKAGDCEGQGCTAGDCTGDGCIAGNCKGENCTGGKCNGVKCKSGDCYGIGCTEGKCTDPKCVNCKSSDKDCKPCYQPLCANGRPYLNERPLNFIRQFLKENSSFNRNICNNNLSKDMFNGQSSYPVYTPLVTELNYYHDGWQPVSWAKPKPGEGEPSVTQIPKIIGSKPKVSQGVNCQWCGKDAITGIKMCSNYFPQNQGTQPYEDPDKNVHGVQSLWKWVKGTESVCYPRSFSGYVIPCDWHKDNNTGIYTYQHNMVLQSDNSYVCTICGRSCTM